MKIGVANRVYVLDVDLAETMDLNPTYSDCVQVFEAGSESADEVAQEWLYNLSVNSGE